MEIRSFLYELKDGKQYEFCERAKEDIDYSHLQGLVRKQKIKEVYEFIPVEDSDRRDMLIADHFNRIYNLVEISLFLSSSPEEIKKLVYHSFKIKNAIPFEKFTELVDDSLAKKLLNLITDLEKNEEGLPDKDVCESLGIKKEQLVKINKTQPHVYQWLKTNVKKKTVRE
jgi:hypothetical protein